MREILRRVRIFLGLLAAPTAPTSASGTSGRRVHFRLGSTGPYLLR